MGKPDVLLLSSEVNKVRMKSDLAFSSKKWHRDFLYSFSFSFQKAAILVYNSTTSFKSSSTLDSDKIFFFGGGGYKLSSIRSDKGNIES